MRTPEQKAQFEYVLAASDAAIGKYLADGLHGLTEVERTVCAVWIVDSEVNNGGFDQYFFNSSGDIYPEVPDALERIGAPRAASLARRAIAAFPSGQPALENFARQDQLLSLTEQNDAFFEELDQAWYTEIEDLEALLASYLRTKRAG